MKSGSCHLVPMPVAGSECSNGVVTQSVTGFLKRGPPAHLGSQKRDPGHVIQKSVDFYASGHNRIRVYHLFDLFAMVDDYKVYVERGWRSGRTGRRAGRTDDDSGSGAVRIYSVGPGTARPLLGRRVSAVDDVIHLRNVTSAIIVL